MFFFVNPNPKQLFKVSEIKNYKMFINSIIIIVYDLERELFVVLNKLFDYTHSLIYTTQCFFDIDPLSEFYSYMKSQI